MVPARLAEKMSVMSVGTSPFSAHRTIAAERVHIAFTGPVRAASGAWRRPGRPQGLPRAARTARARGRGRVGAPPAHAAPGEGSAPGGWASDMPAVGMCARRATDPPQPPPAPQPAHRFSLRSPQDGSIFCLGSPRRPTSTSLARFPRRPEHGTARARLLARAPSSKSRRAFVGKTSDATLLSSRGG